MERIKEAFPKEWEKYLDLYEADVTKGDWYEKTKKAVK